ncbi:MAG: secretin N-terminal domain-containing protein [Phycisphaerales bacterium]
MVKLLNARLEELRREAGLSEDAVAGSVEVVADRQTNTLIVTAPVELVDVAREIIAQLDSGENAVGRDVLRVIPLRFADAAQTAPALRAPSRPPTCRPAAASRLPPPVAPTRSSSPALSPTSSISRTSSKRSMSPPVTNRSPSALFT